MTTNVVIVDDRDSPIQYAGSWNDAGAEVEFHGTTRWASQAGSTASFTFSGSSVTVYGSVAAKNPAEASLNFVIDNSVTGSYTPSDSLDEGLFHEALWTSPSMSEGTHTLVITQTRAADEGQIYLDYMLYTTASDDSGGPYFIDDRDSRITYTPAWRQFGSENDFQHTSQESTSTGDSFSLTFEGTRISFYGGLTTSDAGLMKASMVLDGGSPVVYNAPNPIPATTNNLIYTSEDLPDGTHTLVVTAETDQTMWADYFLVTPNTPSSLPPQTPPSPPTTPTSLGSPTTTPGPSPVSPSSPSAPSGSHSVSSGSHIITSGTHPVGSGGAPDPSSIFSLSSSSLFPSGTASSSSSDSDTPVSTSSKSTPTAAIVAGLLGALLLVALVCATIFCIRRRQRRQVGQTVEDPAPPMASATAAIPFVTRGAATSHTALNSTYGYSESAAAASTSDLEHFDSTPSLHASNPFADIVSGSDAAPSQPALVSESPQRHSTNTSISNPTLSHSSARESTTSADEALLRPLQPVRRNSKLAAEGRWQQNIHVSVTLSSGAPSIAGSSRVDGEEAPPQYAA
ncbi:hypothetical protein B0H17DRAFT_986855 [Mycena rosella]|uniref:Uncharacterized protein n=1 Tax=Mycena rosella TaxID=1033263 RepID=A0AAD7D5M5_MYCRO|nr:hypothetical protein B0H17DRAFT_986855 [Mycena rosella]